MPASGVLVPGRHGWQTGVPQAQDCVVALPSPGEHDAIGWLDRDVGASHLGAVRHDDAIDPAGFGTVALPLNIGIRIHQEREDRFRPCPDPRLDFDATLGSVAITLLPLGCRLGGAGSEGGAVGASETLQVERPRPALSGPAREAFRPAPVTPWFTSASARTHTSTTTFKAVRDAG